MNKKQETMYKKLLGLSYHCLTRKKDKTLNDDMLLEALLSLNLPPINNAFDHEEIIMLIKK